MLTQLALTLADRTDSSDSWCTPSDLAALVSCDASWAPFRRRLKFERPGKPPLTANFASVLVWRDWTLPNAMRPQLWLADGGAS